MFDFGIINTPDGNQVIDHSLKTPYNALTPVQMLEYMEMDAQLAVMDRLERKRRSQEEHRWKRARNPFYKLACMCGMV